jgi:hypothetical protein
MSLENILVTSLHQLILQKRLLPTQKHCINFLRDLYTIKLKDDNKELVFKLECNTDQIAYDQSVCEYFTLETRTTVKKSFIEYIQLLKEQLLSSFNTDRIVLKFANGFHACPMQPVMGWVALRLRDPLFSVALIYGKLLTCVINFTCENNQIEHHSISMQIPHTSSVSIQKLNESASQALETDEGFFMDTNLQQINKWGHEQYCQKLEADESDFIEVFDADDFFNGFENPKTKTHCVFLSGHGVRFS